MGDLFAAQAQQTGTIGQARGASATNEDGGQAKGASATNEDGRQAKGASATNGDGRQARGRAETQEHREGKDSAGRYGMFGRLKYFSAVPKINEGGWF